MVVLKVAVTCWLVLRVNAQDGLFPLQAPVHPAKLDFAAGLSVRVTWVPLVNAALHVAPQLMPAGALLTVPPPPPAACTLN
jgi:hypothetical protein